MKAFGVEIDQTDMETAIDALAKMIDDSGLTPETWYASLKFFKSIRDETIIGSCGVSCALASGARFSLFPVSKESLYRRLVHEHLSDILYNFIGCITLIIWMWQK